MTIPRVFSETKSLTDACDGRTYDGQQIIAKAHLVNMDVLLKTSVLTLISNTACFN